MPLLAYCVMEAAAAAETPATGVGGMKVGQLQHGGLCCFFSPLESREHLARVPVVESALAFHHTLQNLFQQATVIPFRFPTVVESEEELQLDLQENGPRYEEALARLRNMVQMEVRITEMKGAAASQQPASGREYLRGRQARADALAAAAQQFRQATREWVAEWRQRRVQEGMRCYALMHREALAGFQQAAQGVTASAPGSRVSGPWPPIEFLEPGEDES